MKASLIIELIISSVGFILSISPTSMEPIPPALHTAIARSVVLPTKAIPAAAKGNFTLYSLEKRV